MSYYGNCTLIFDGACFPNPGRGGGGYVLYDDFTGTIILEGRCFVGVTDCTNNVAEYLGLMKGLEAILHHNITMNHLYIQGNSALVIKQLNGEYEVRSHRLINSYRYVDDMLRHRFSSCSLHVIPRDQNQRADGLAKDAVATGQSMQWYH